MPDGQKLIVACSSCATQYNVATLQPGAKFKCQKCGTVNAVPAKTAPQSAAKPPTRLIANAPVRTASGTKPPTRLIAPAKGMGVKTSSFKKGLPVRRPAGDSDEGGLGGIRVKKKSNANLILILGILSLTICAPLGIIAWIMGSGNIKKARQMGTQPESAAVTGRVLGIIGTLLFPILIIIALAVGSGKSSEEEAIIKKAEIQEAEKTEVSKETDTKTEETKKSEEEKKTVEESPAPESKKEPPPAPKKSSKPKIQDDIDAVVKAEIEPILKEISKQRDPGPSIEKIKEKGKKAMPILIEAIGGADGDAARYAYEILLKMTKRNPDDTTRVNQMLSRDMRRDCQKDWEEWWFKTKDSIPD